jgi:nitrate/nitrite transporter NarK
MGTPVFLQILQSFVVIAVAPLCSGILARVEAIVGSKRDPNGVQPYRDLAKWLRNSRDQAPWVFRSAPFVAFVCCLTVSAIVPIITNQLLSLAFLADLISGAFALTPASLVIALSGLDTASPLGGLGVSRASWISNLAEPLLILVFVTVGAVSASDNPYSMNHAVADSPTGTGGVFAWATCRARTRSVGSVTGIVAAAGGLGGYFLPLVIGATYDPVGNDYTVELLLVATALVAFGYMALRLRAWVLLMFVVAGLTAAVFKPLLRGAHPCKRV